MRSAHKAILPFSAVSFFLELCLTSNTQKRSKEKTFLILHHFSINEDSKTLELYGGHRKRMQL